MTQQDAWMAEVEREASELKLEDRTLEDRAHRSEPPEPMATCALCSRSVRFASMSRVNGRPGCADCVATLRRELAEQRPRGTGMLYGGGWGLIGALAGAAVWAAIAIATNFEVGYIAVLVGYLAGAGVRYGAGKQRGPALQYLAVALSVVGLLAAKYIVFSYSLVDFARVKGVDIGYFDHIVISHFPAFLRETIGPLDAVFLFIAMAAAYRVTKTRAITIHEG